MALEKITEAQMDAKGVCAAPDILNGTPAQNKSIFDRMVRQLIAPAYNACVDLVNTLETAEDTRQAAEALRVSAEDLRAAAETARDNAESGRITAEEARAEAERLRVSAEQLRADAEALRIQAEQERISNETARKKSEETRAEAEESRQAAENTRKSNETSRKYAEIDREDAENGRAEAEGQRVSAEASRVAAEKARASAEVSRVTAEESRVTAEQKRAEAERFRYAADRNRDIAETQRIAAEEDRVSAEAARSFWKDYKAEKAYVPGNKVAYEGSSYLNISACAGIDPTNTGYWLLIARAGDSVAVDDTLTESGKAADAAVVGERLSSLSKVKVSQAELGENNVVSFKNAEGVVLFTLDLSGLGVATYGNLVLSVETLTVEEGGTGTFTVALDSAPSAIQTVYLAVSDNTRLAVEPASLIFTPENWETPQTVTVASVQDDDNVDDSITVALTSKNVDGKQLVVTVSDNYYVPELVTNGLVLHFDYTNKVDDTSDTIADLVYGVTATGFSSMSKTVNGIYSNGTEAWLTPDKTSEAYNAFKQAFAESTQKGFTVESFGNFYARMFYFQKSAGASTYTSLIHTGTYPISAGNVGSGSPGSAVPYLNSSGETMTITKYSNKNFSVAENYDKYFHLAIVFNPDGTIKFYANGVDITNASDTAPDGFTAWDIDTIADNLYLLCSAGNRFPTSDAFFLAEQRMYNRPLTQDEIIQNMEYTASKLGLLTF